MPEKPNLSDDERLARADGIELAATDLLIAVWKGLQNGSIPDRGAIDDAALHLRDALNPEWPQNSNWLPEALRSDT